MLSLALAAGMVFAPGDYLLDATVKIGFKDGGTAEAPSVWKAEEPGTVRLIGARRLNWSDFTRVTDKAILARVDEAVRDKLVVCDLLSIYPGEMPAWPKAFNIPPAPWLYADGEPQEIARWPNLEENDGWTAFTTSVDTGYPDKDKYSNPGKKMHPGAFVYNDPRAKRWNLEEGVWLYGYWTHDWSENFIKAGAWEKDGTNDVLRLAGTHDYGCGNGTWGAKKRRFFVLNSLEELDTPGEWWIDRPAKKLYVYPKRAWTHAELMLATFEKSFVEIENASDIRFENLTFACSHAKGAAVSVKGGKNIVFENCTFENLAGPGISLIGDDCRISGCTFRNLGANAITLVGGDRKRLRKGNNRVSACDIHHYARFRRTYAPAVGVYGCGQIVRNTRIHDAPHNAILYGGNEHLFESNEVYRVLTETGDAGAFYTGRDTSTLGNMIRGNHFHDLGKDGEMSEMTMAVYFDDCDWGDAVISNRFERLGIGVMIGGGNLHPVTGNVFDSCKVAVHIDARGMTWRQGRKAFLPNKEGVSWYESFLRPFDYTRGAWAEAYPELPKLLAEHPELPMANPVSGNEFINCSRIFDLDGASKACLERDGDDLRSRCP